jgi:hypothetical protein
VVAVAERLQRLQLTNLRRLALSRWGALFVLTGAAGIALRVWTYRSPLTIPNSDEALVGLMVRHAQHGEFSTFFWGRAYGGTQEVLLAVPGFWLFGTSLLALRMVPIVLSVIATLLIWRVGRRTIGEPAAAVAAGLFWLWPPFNFLQLVREQGFYASDVVYVALLLLLALRVVERPDRIRVGLFGLVFGLAFWQTAQIIPFAATAIVWTIWKQPRCLRAIWVAVPLAALGALPWLVWNIGHHFESLSQNPGWQTYKHAARLLVSPVMPMTVGLRAPYTHALFVPSALLTWLVYAGLVALFVYGWIKARGRPAGLLYAAVVVFALLYGLPRKTSFISAYPQYTTVLTPLLALVVAQVATKYARAVALLVLVFAITAVNLHRMQVWLKVPQPLPNAPRSYSPLISTLDQLGLDRVYADYWIAYRLDFDTRERIIAVENQFSGVRFVDGQAIPSPDPEVRYRPYDREVEAAPRHGFVFWRQTVRSVSIVPALVQHGYVRHLAGPFVVYAPPSA